MEQHLKEAFLSQAKENAGCIPVAAVEAVAPDSGNFSWKDYYQRALRALDEPLLGHKIDYGNFDGHSLAGKTAGGELRYALEHALRFRRPAAMMIDEAQHLTKMASGSRLSDQLDSVKSLASLSGCLHVLIGTYELLPCRNLSAQLSRRSIDIHFRRYQNSDAKDVEAFQRVLFSFQRQLPLAEEPQLWRDWEYCYARSIGCVGLLKDWLTRGLAAALEEGATTLTRKHLEKHSWSADQCEKIAQEVGGAATMASVIPDFASNPSGVRRRIRTSFFSARTDSPSIALLFVIPQLRLTKWARLLSEQFTDLHVFPAH